MHASCAQVTAPVSVPEIEQEAFDLRLQKLLNFSVPLLGVDELAEAAADKYLLLDARELEEFQVSHIPGAKHFGYKNPDWVALRAVDKAQPIVMYCSVGYRSEKLGEQLLERGYANVYNLYGSIFEWANQGNRLEDNNGVATKSIHTYNRKWSQWVQDKNNIEKVW